MSADVKTEVDEAPKVLPRHVDGEGGEEDEVVAEYDVVMSQQLSGCLHVFQYPLRSATNPYEYSLVEVVRQNRSVSAAADAPMVSTRPRYQMRFALDVVSRENFNKEKLSVTTGSHNYEVASSPSTTQCSYAVGVLRGNEVHMTAVDSIETLLPVVKSPNTHAEDIFDSKQVLETESSAVQQHLEKQLHRLRSISLRQDANNAEIMDHYSAASVESGTVRDRLFGATAAPVALSTSGGRLVDSLFPYDENTSSANVLPEAPAAPPQRFAHLVPLETQVVHLINSAQVLPYCQIKRKLRMPDDSQPQDNAVLAALKRCAVFVDGRWVAMTDSRFDGVQAVIREYIILQFRNAAGANNSGPVTKEALMHHWPSSRADVAIMDKILDALGARSDKDPKVWVLKAEADGFADLFPHDARMQHDEWEARNGDIQQHMVALCSGRHVPTAALRLRPTLTIDDVGGSGGGGGNSLTPGSPTRFGGEAMPVRLSATTATSRERFTAEVKKYIRALFGHYGIINSQVCKSQLAQATKQANSPIYLCPSDVIGQVAKTELQVFRDNAWILRSVDPQTDDYRKIIVEVLRPKSSFSKSDLVEEVEAAAKKSRPHDPQVPQYVLTKVLAEMADFRVGEKLWHIKSGTVPVQTIPTAGLSSPAKQT